MAQNSKDEMVALLKRGYGDKIKKKLKLRLSVRQVQRIVKKGLPDEYGIIEEALRMAAVERRRREKVARQKKLLSLSSPSNHNKP